MARCAPLDTPSPYLVSRKETMHTLSCHPHPPSATATHDRAHQAPAVERRPAMIVFASLLAGLARAVGLVAGPRAGGPEAVITGGLLLGFTAGWALLAVLSARFTDRPQRWAAVPAAA